MKTIARALLAFAAACLLFGQQASNVDNPTTPFSLLPGQINSRIVGPINTAMSLRLIDPTTAKGDIIVRSLSNPIRVPWPGSDGVYCANWAAAVLTWVPCTTGGGGSGAWGGITGFITDQTDLIAVLATKQNALTVGNTSQFIRGDLSLAPFPTIPSITGASIVKAFNGNAVPATSADVAGLWTIVGGGAYMRVDGTTGDPTGGTAPGPVGAVGAIQKNAGGGAFAAAIAGTDFIAAGDSRLTDARTPSAHAATHAAGQSDPITPASIGAVVTTDSRMSDSRVPLNHASTHKIGGGDPVGTATPAANAIPQADGTGHLLTGWMPDMSATYILGSLRAAANGVASLDGSTKIPYSQIPVGTGASTIAAGDDARLTNSRTPTAHAATHENGGSDPIANSIPTANAIPMAGVAGTLAPGWIPTLNQSTTGTAGGITGKTFVGTATQIPLMLGTPTGTKCLHTDGSGNITETSTDCGSGGGAAGSGSEIQYRTSSGLGAVPGSVVTGSAVAFGGSVTATGSFITAGNAGALHAGPEQVAPTVSAPTLYFDSTAHAPQYKNASNALVATMVAPIASPGDANCLDYIGTDAVQHRKPCSTGTGTVTAGTTGEFAYYAADGTAIGGLTIPADGTYCVTYSSGVPSWGTCPSSSGAASVGSVNTLNVANGSGGWASTDMSWGGTGNGLTIPGGVTSTGPFFIKGAEQSVSALANPAASAQVAAFDTTTHMLQHKDSTGTVKGTTVAGIANPSDTNCVGYVGTNGVQNRIPCGSYQTILNGGSAQTQRGKFNLVAGGNLSIATVDNAGSDRTDITITANSNTDILATATTAYSVAVNVSLVLCDATSAPVTVTLPLASGSRRSIVVKKTDSSANACTVQRTSSDTIDGATSYTLTKQYVATRVVDTNNLTWVRTSVIEVGGDISGPSTGATVAKVQGKAIDAPTTKGDLYVYDGTALKRIGVGSDTQVLTADSAQPLGVKWATPGTSGSGFSILNSWCQGPVGTTSGTVYYLAPGTISTVNTACNNTTVQGNPMPVACTVSKLYVLASAAGALSGSGVVKMYKNGSSTSAPTCTLGTGTSCNDTSTSLAYAAGDTWAVSVTTAQASDTTANLRVAFICQ